MGVHYDKQFHDGRFVYSTGEKIHRDNWNTGKGQPRAGFEHVNIRLKTIATECEKFIVLNRQTLAKASLKAYLDSLRPKEVSPNTKRTMKVEWDEYLSLQKISKATMIAYRGSRDTFFEKFSEDLMPQDFTYDKMKTYEIWLGEKYEANTVAKKLKHLVLVLRHMKKMIVNIGLSIDDIKYKEQPGLKIAATEQELDKMMELDLTGFEKISRDLFVLQSNIGVRIGDLMRLNPHHFKGEEAQIHTQKVTGKIVEVPLTPTARKILESYEYQIPKIIDQYYREHLKYVYKKINENELIEIRTKEGFKMIPKHQLISPHDAIRTFVQIAHLRGMTISAIATIVGKSVKTLLRHYLVESQHFAKEEMKKAWG